MTTKFPRRYLLGFFVILILVGFIGLRFWPGRGVDRQLQTIRAEGLPASASELDRWYKAVPLAENRALLVMDTARSLVVAPSTLARQRGEPTTPEMLSAIREHLEKNREVLAKLHRVRELPFSRYPVDLSTAYAISVSHVGVMKETVNLLQFEADYAAATGDPTNAVAAVASGLAVANTVRQEPLLISELVGIAADSMMLKVLERILNKLPLSDSQLEELSRFLSEEEKDSQDQILRALVGERAIGLSVFDLSFQQFQGLGGVSPGGVNGSDRLKTLGYQAYAVFGLRQRDQEIFLETMQHFCDAARAVDFPVMLAEFRRAEAGRIERLNSGFGRFAIFSRMLTSGLERSAGKGAMVTARFRCAEVALAIERFRLQHGDALPDSLQSLAPQFLHKLPSDPFDGSPLVYSKEGKGYKVISPGATAQRKQEVKNGYEVEIQVAR